MSDYNKNDDFFTSEYEKLNQQSQPDPSRVDVEGWYNFNSQKVEKPPKRNWSIAVISILMVLAFIGGFIFSTMLKDAPPEYVPTNELLNEVIKTIDEKLLYADDLTTQDEINMIEQAGTAMLQSVDKYGRLLSPQSAYNLFYPVAGEITNGNQLYFGISYQYATFGLYISSVMADSNSYGKLFEGDLIVHFANRVDSNGQKLDDFSVIDYAQADVVEKMAETYSCTVSVLRDGDLLKVDLQRAKVGNGNNEFVMVEYYFGANNTNLSTTAQNGAAVSSVEGRQLDRLPSNVGYIKLNEFERYSSGSTTISAESEFKQALEKFRVSGKTKLIVDLKGNPGGYVVSACNIAGMLTYNKQSAGQLLGCTLVDKDGATEYYYAQSGYMLYDRYFGSQDGDTKDIVVWTDGSSASSSELLVGALLSYGTVVHMGTTSYGKGIAQTSEELPYTGEIVYNTGHKGTFNWYIYYTTAYFYSPSGENIHGVGYTPDSPYNNLKTYDQLVDAVIGYWG